MKTVRLVLGFLSGAFLLLSGLAHSILGWKGLSAELAKAQVPSDMIQAVAIGWHFGGAAMLAFGIIVLWSFIDRARGRVVSTRPVALIGLLYVAFGGWALVVSNMSPFFLMFVVLGVLLLAASWQPKGEGA